MKIALLLLSLFAVFHSPACADRPLTERMAAFHETIVATDELRPNSCITTYIKEHFTYMDSYLLAKLVTGVEAGGGTMWPASAQAVRVEDIPGGVKAEYELGGVKVTTEIVPLLVGRDTPEQEGAALYSVSTSPAARVVVRCGGGAVVGGGDPRSAWLRIDTMGREGDSAEISRGKALLRCPHHPFTVAVAASGAVSIERGEDGGESTLVRLPGGSGRIVVSYARDPAAAVRLASVDPVAARREVSDYYDRLLQCSIETPEQVIDRAFRSALYNLEYNWLTPYGWVECIHHWLSLWHMQHTGAAEWIGQSDRSRECNLTTAANLLPDGSIPQFSPAGSTRRDFGGSNQFFAWQMRHYWRMTADIDTVRRVAPSLERAIEQTFKEYDREGDGLLAWGQQIGNQEDYVSTPFNGASPSVEAINMLRTGAELARARGEREKVSDYDRRADEIQARLRSELWQPDLGRFAFYKDPLGVLRPDGQYHTQIYPVIWGLLDPFDSWTSIRHLRDRMIGEGGETYCSNNFPCHTVCTCGPQAGAAQQPWAAWGLAAVGLRNETFRPLKAAAQWAMDGNHRGSWPEISIEHTPAYFSPPAGLFVQSVIEALFGLTVDMPAGHLTIAPSFPDSWPSARLNLPHYSARYARQGDSFEYEVTSAASLARRVRWMLPPCRVTQVLVNGRSAKHELLPGVGCVILSVDTAPAIRTLLKISLTPEPYRIERPASVAEGDPIRVKASGCTIESIDDRCGVLSAIRAVSGSGIEGTLRTGLLDPYLRFGRLGQLNFSRRTLFLSCVTSGGARFWEPVDLAILPRYECAAVGEVALAAGGGSVTLLLRNSTSARLKGTAHLRAARQAIPFDIDLPARSECTRTVMIPRSGLALLSPGDNRASVMLPGPSEVGFTLAASRLFESDSLLAGYARSRIRRVPLPQEALKPDTGWREVRGFSAYGHPPWNGSRPPLESASPGATITVPELPQVTFHLQDRGFVPISLKSGRPSFSLDMGGLRCRKVYLLVIPLLDNHDTFIAAARVDVRSGDDLVISRVLHSPGDLDWWNPAEVVGEWSTSRVPRPGRHDLLPMLAVSSPDWLEGAPPAFPQPQFWASCLACKTPASVMNVVEIDLGRATTVDSLMISAFGVDPALGLVAVSVEVEDGQRSLQGTEWMPPPKLREPLLLFSFNTPGDLLGWTTEGNAFSVAPVPSLFTVPTLNSLAAAGESATGRAVSPEFEIGADDVWLAMEFQGGNSTAPEGPGCLSISLVDSATGEVLVRQPVTGSHVLRDGRLPVSAIRGRKVRLEMVDENTGQSYAWLGIRRVSLLAD